MVAPSPSPAPSPAGALPSRVGVILYVNRSGSTLLSRLLSDSGADLFVFPELHFTLDLLAAQRQGRAIGADAVAARLLADPRVAALGIDAGALEALARRHGDDLHALLDALATASLGRRPGAIVVKLERYGEFVPELDAALGRPVLIHALRDPRAAVNSMLKTPVTGKPGFDMARGSAIWAARHWRRYVDRIAGLAAAGRPVVTVRYEAMVAAPEAAVAPVLAALGTPVGSGAGPGARRYVVADADAALHARVHAPVTPARIAGWRTELSPAQIAAIETICASTMQATGYAPGSASGRRGVALPLQTRHALAMLRHASGTVCHYAGSPTQRRLLRDRLRLAWAARGYGRT